MPSLTCFDEDFLIGFSINWNLNSIPSQEAAISGERAVAQRDYSPFGEDARRAFEIGLTAAQRSHSERPRKVMKDLMARSDGPAIRFLRATRNDRPAPLDFAARLKIEQAIGIVALV